MLTLTAKGMGNELQTSTTLVSRWNITTSIPLQQVIIQSHRGAGVLAAENTTASFELGWKLQTYPEGDLRTTTDGVIVTFHDADFKRVTRNVPDDVTSKGIGDVSWPQLQRIEVGEWKGETFVAHRVPQVSEVFALMRGKSERHLYLDIKNVKLPDLAKQVIEHHVEKQVVLAAPKHSIIREWKKLVPESDTLLWMRGTDAQLKKQFEELRKANYEGITQLQVHVHLKLKPEQIKRDTPEPFQEGDEFLIGVGEELRARGILYQTLPYGGSTRDIYWKLLDLGLMSFATDYPDLVKDALATYYSDAAANHAVTNR